MSTGSNRIAAGVVWQAGANRMIPTQVFFGFTWRKMSPWFSAAFSVRKPICAPQLS